VTDRERSAGLISSDPGDLSLTQMNLLIFFFKGYEFLSGVPLRAFEGAFNGFQRLDAGD